MTPLPPSAPFDPAAALRRMRTTIVIQGVLSVLAGLVMAVWPDIALLVLVLLLAAWLIADGLIAIARWIGARGRSTSSWPLLRGGLALLIGVIVLLLPRESAGVIAVIAGLWALALGTLTVFGALTLRRLGGPLWWGLLLVGGLGVVVGLVLLFDPAAGIVSVLWLVAAFLILMGIASIVLGIRVGHALGPVADGERRFGPTLAFGGPGSPAAGPGGFTADPSDPARPGWIPGSLADDEDPPSRRKRNDRDDRGDQGPRDDRGRRGEG